MAGAIGAPLMRLRNTACLRKSRGINPVAVPGPANRGRQAHTLHQAQLVRRQERQAGRWGAVGLGKPTLGGRWRLMQSIKEAVRRMA